MRQESVRVVCLPRNYKMEAAEFQNLTRVLERGYHIHASTDIPGRFTPVHAKQEGWAEMIDHLFGIDVRIARPGFDSGDYKFGDFLKTYKLMPTNVESSVGAFHKGDEQIDLWTWKLWGDVLTTDGLEVLYHRGFEDWDNMTYSQVPALVLKNHTHAKTAINLFNLGDTLRNDKFALWDIRADVLSTIYKHHFGLKADLELYGNGSRYVARDYRTLHDGSVLLGLSEYGWKRLAEPDYRVRKVPEGQEGGGVDSRRSTRSRVSRIGGNANAAG